MKTTTHIRSRRHGFLFALLGIASLAVPTAAFAQATRAITITTDAFPGSYAIDIDRGDQGEVKALIYQRDHAPAVTLTVDDLKSGKPRSLLNQNGRDVILLSLESDFNPNKGGHAVVRFLHNGVTGSYKDFRILIDVQSDIVLRSDPNSSDADSDNNGYTSQFNQLFMKKNSVFGKTVGIDKIIPSLN